jgi:ATP-dependent RNA helicase SUPV3L1/SUV3
LSEKAFVEMQALWKVAIGAAAAPLEALQKQSIELRHAMIEEAIALGGAAELRVDAVKALQQRWQAQAHAVPIDRRLEQKLWDAFRKPIDDAFNRKTAAREQAETALGGRDRAVLAASKALEAANASGDAQAIRAAMAALDAALQGQAQAQADVQAAGEVERQAQVASKGQDSDENTAVALVEPAQAATETIAISTDAAAPAEVAPTPKALPKRVVAMRGDDRPGMKKEAPAPARGGKWGDRKDSGHGARDGKPGGAPHGRGPGGDGRGRDARPDAGPRLGDAAFRAQRDAMDNAQNVLKKLASQAHGEALTQLLTAWEKRDPALVPSAQDLGIRSSPAVRTAWVQALTSGNAAPAAKPATAQEALLRLEMAAEVPTPAEDISARRTLQLQLLTRRNDPAPSQTWGQDAAVVLAGAFEPQAARRIQNVLKVLLKK